MWIHRSPQEEEGELGLIRINPAMKRHFKLEIKTLSEAPRDVDKLRRILISKQIEWEDTMKIEEIERLATEIEMLRFVLCAVRMNK